MKRISILLILLIYGATPIRAQPDGMDTNDNYCRYDSQCEAGYFCYQNQCTHLLPTLTPIVSEVPSKPIETNITEFEIYDQHLMNNANNDDSGAILNESVSSGKEVIHEMDECGNVYDLDGNLLWGSGECNVDSTNEKEAKVYVVGNSINDIEETSLPTSTPLPTPSWDDFSINSFIPISESNQDSVNDNYQGLKYLVICVGSLLIIATIGYTGYVINQNKKKKTF